MEGLLAEIIRITLYFLNHFDNDAPRFCSWVYQYGYIQFACS